METPGPAEPTRDCAFCARLVGFRVSNRAMYPDWHNAPVASFGSLDARLLIVGLAPGLKGANRTGRPFTGDFAGDLLYDTLVKVGFAEGKYAQRADDGLGLIDCRISNAVRCVPPENKPTPAEITTCRRFLQSEVGMMPRLRAILALGRISHDSVVIVLGARSSQFPFRHGAVHRLQNKPYVADSYHCSRHNTQTGKLTPAAFEEVVRGAKALLDA